MNLETFKQQTLGKTYGNPPPLLVPNMNTFIGECVSYVRQGNQAMYNFDLGAIGNAVEYASLANQEKFKAVGFTWLPGELNRQDGDILVWEDDKGNFTGPAGHLGYSYHGNILNQNNVEGRFVTVDKFFTQGYLGLYRKVEMNATVQTEDEAAELIRGVLKREPQGNEIADMMGRYWKERIVYLRTSAAGKDVQYKVDNYGKDSQYEEVTVYRKIK